jgi:uncharacterized membrane protein YwzB
LKGGENELKQIMKKVKWLSLAQILFAFAVVIAPVALVPAPVAHAGVEGTADFECGSVGQGLLNCNKTDNSVKTWIVRIIRVVLAITLAVDVLFLIIGGFLYITSAGNEDRAKKGRTTVINAVIGLIIIVLAYLISTFVVNFFSNQTSTSGNI